MAASHYEHLGTVQVLLEHSANAHILDKEGRNCLHYAILGCNAYLIPEFPIAGRLAILDELLTIGNLEVIVKDKYHKTPLDYACDGGKPGMVNLPRRYARDT